MSTKQKKQTTKKESKSKENSPLKDHKKGTAAKSVNEAAKSLGKKPGPVSKSKDIPTLESILNDADRAFTDIVKRYMKLGESLVKAITFYGAAGKRAFRTRFPLTDNALRNLELVGRGVLLPQFAMCSDRFVKGLVDMADSITWQYKLLGASKNGMIRIRIEGGEIVDASFEDLKSDRLVDGVLSVISDEDKDLPPEKICEKLLNLRREVKSRFDKKPRPFFSIGMLNGTKVVRFFKSRPITAIELEQIISKLKS